MALQIARIETHLQSADSVEERVHDLRKRTKETRALLRLVRSSLGSQFAIENLKLSKNCVNTHAAASRGEGSEPPSAR